MDEMRFGDVIMGTIEVSHYSGYRDIGNTPDTLPIILAQLLSRSAVGRNNTTPIRVEQSTGFPISSPSSICPRKLKPYGILKAERCYRNHVRRRYRLYKSLVRGILKRE